MVVRGETWKCTAREGTGKAWGRRGKLLFGARVYGKRDRKNFRVSYASPCVWSYKGTRGQGSFQVTGACCQPDMLGDALCSVRYQGEPVIFCLVWL